MIKRKNHSGPFKSKVALEALRGEQTLSELSLKFEIHPNMITKWKRDAIKGLEEVFSGNRLKTVLSHDSEIKELHAKIGQLTVERDFLSKAFNR